LEFWLERVEFATIPKGQLEQYRGQFVASRHGEIKCSDTDLESLADKFFTKFGDVPVYMTKIGELETEIIDTPFEE